MIFRLFHAPMECHPVSQEGVWKKSQDSERRLTSLNGVSRRFWGVLRKFNFRRDFTIFYADFRCKSLLGAPEWKKVKIQFSKFSLQSLISNIRFQQNLRRDLFRSSRAFVPPRDMLSAQNFGSNRPRRFAKKRWFLWYFRSMIFELKFESQRCMCEGHGVLQRSLLVW